MNLSLIIFFSALILLFIGTQLLVNASITLSNKLSMNRIIIGFTIVSLATSLPEFFVTLSSSLKGYYDFAIGNIIGSNISNISLVLGVTTLITPVVFSKKEIYLNYFPLVLISILFVSMFVFVGVFNLVSGLISLLILIAFNIFLFKKGVDVVEIEDQKNVDIFIFFGKEITIKRLSYLILILFSGALILWIGSEMLINSSKEIATKLGVSDRVISISLVALGTSLPELFASIYAAYKKEAQLAIGNLLGSNIFNILAVIGATTCMQSISVSSNLLPDVIIMLLITLLLLPCFYIRNIFSFTKNSNTMLISKSEGFFLVITYILYISFVIS